MTEANTYAKSFTSKRKPIEQSDVYHVVVFPCDNSFSVVKSKQCSPDEKDGFVIVQSGNKKYTGFIFQTGTLELCSKAADLLTQKQNNDIESDYEKENSRSKDTAPDTSETRTFTTLRDIPFSVDCHTSNINQDSSRCTFSNSKVTDSMTPTRVTDRAGNARISKGWQRSRNENGTIETVNKDKTSVSATTGTSTPIRPNNVSLSSLTNEKDLIVRQKTTTLNSTSNIISSKRRLLDSSRSPPHKRNNNKSKKAIVRDDTSSSDVQSDDDDPIQSIELVKTPTFNGRRLTTSAVTNSPVSSSVEKDSYFKTLEQKYFIPLILNQERLEIMMKSLYNNQKKIQKALNKKQIPVSLQEPGVNGDDDNTDFPRTLIAESCDGESSFDLLKIPATKDRANLYVTALTQKLYTMEDLVALEPDETHNDDRYKLIQQAVRCKFKLTGDQLEQIFSDWLREVFLAKRRAAVAKNKSLNKNQ